MQKTIYFLVSMVLVGLSCFMTVLVLNIHYKNNELVAPGIKNYVIKPLQRLACLQIEHKHDKNDNLYPERHKKEHIYTNRSYNACEESENETSSPLDPERSQAARFQRELLNLVREIRDCTSTILAYEEGEPNHTDWSSLAVALDRIFLVGYLVFTLVVSLTIMLTASSGE